MKHVYPRDNYRCYPTSGFAFLVRVAVLDVKRSYLYIVTCIRLYTSTIPGSHNQVTLFDTDAPGSTTESNSGIGPNRVITSNGVIARAGLRHTQWRPRYHQYIALPLALAFVAVERYPIRF